MVKKFLPQSGEGPSEEYVLQALKHSLMPKPNVSRDRNNGFLLVTNITKSTSQPPVHVKSVIKGKGDSYLLTSSMSPTVSYSPDVICKLLKLILTSVIHSHGV